ncbi:MAG: insulinase family protein [Desulfovibrio sp.]|jgi:zinc protease|nr:insulinase family protein [Desulfovibrio sp.]
MKITNPFFLAGVLMTVCFSLLAGTWSASASSGPLVTRLANGLTVAVKKDDRFPLVSLRLYVHAGSAYEEDGEAGISHLLEHMVFKGTAKRPKNSAAADVEAKGGYINAATSFDYTVYLTDMPGDSWKIGLDVLKDMAFHPALDPLELEAEKEVVLAELKRGEDSPGQRVFRMVQRIALQDTPYRNPIIGYEPIIRELTAERIRRYIDRHYQPQSMLLLICGAVDEAEALAEAEALFGALANTREISPPSPLQPRPSAFRAAEEKGPWTKVHLALALPVPGMSDARSPQLDVLARILGGDATSRFYRSYKYDKRLVDTISVSNYSFERLGMFLIQATLDPDKLAPFWETLVRDLADLQRAAFSREELDRARLNIEDDLFRSKETISGYAEKMGFFQFFDKGEQGESNYLRLVRDTDQAILSDLAASLLRPENLSLAVLLPENAPPLPGKGPAADGSAFSAWAGQTLAELWPSGPAAAAAPDSGGVAPAEILSLGQGRTLILLRDQTLPYIAADLLFSGGDSLLTEKNQGLGAFTASLLTKGTTTLSATDMEEFQADRASSLSASSGRRSFTLSLSAPAGFAADMFALLADVLASPGFREEEADRVRENQAAAITAREEQAIPLALRRMFPFFFPSHSYGFLNLGESARVAAFTAKDAAAFWSEQIAYPWVLAVCGNFDRDALLKALDAFPVPRKKALSLEPPRWGRMKNLDLRLAERNQAHLFLVFPTVGIGNPDEPGLDLLQNILAGQSGLLFRDLRDTQGLGYTVTAFPWKADKAGALIFYIGAEPDKLDMAEQGFRTIIERLQTDPLPAKELERGNRQLSGDYYREHQTLAARSGEAASLTLFGHPLDSPRNLILAASRITPAELQALAQKYLRPDAAYRVRVLP